MANNGYISFKKNLTSKQIDNDLRAIITKRFGSDLVVESNCDDSDEFWYWTVKPFNNNENPLLEFSVEQISKRKFSFHHPKNKFAFWVQTLIQDELALLYNGTISDEGVSEKWKVIKVEHESFVSFLKEEALFCSDPVFFEKIYKMELKMIPEFLKKYS